MSDPTNSRVIVAGKQLVCLFCGGEHFAYREVKMNTTGMSFLNLEWANRSATGAICTACGYIHQFMGEVHWEG